MRAAGDPLMLLLCLSLMWGDAHVDADTPQRVQVDVWAELRALRDMVVEQRVEQRLMADRVRESERQLDQLKRENTALETRMAASEKEVEGLRAKVTGTQSRPSAIESTGQQAPDTKCSALEAKLSAIDRRLELLEGEQVSLSTRLTSSESQAEQLSTRLTSSESRAEAAEKAAADRPKVAFFAALGNHLGPVGASTKVVYSDVVTNAGQAYSPVTGAFTAPVKGVYYFRFTALDDRAGIWIGIIINKNGQLVLSNSVGNNGGYAYLANAVVVELEKGDVVDTLLHPGCRLFGGPSRPTNFSGFLLFPL